MPYIIFIVYIGLVLSVSVSLSVSLSADMKNFIPAFYQYWPIRKLSLSGFIGIGRYKKSLLVVHWSWVYFFNQIFFLRFCDRSVPTNQLNDCLQGIGFNTSINIPLSKRYKDPLVTLNIKSTSENTHENVVICPTPMGE